MPDNGSQGIRPGDAKVLLTGATGFVGRHLWPALEGARCSVRGLTRDAEKARAKHPGRDWMEADVETGVGLEDAMAGCSAAFYLVHGMGRPGFRERERESARRFAAAAERAGLRRIVYLGGIAPAGEPSEHLASRLEVGTILCEGAVPTLELRASMIIGCGSLSWWIVRDLAARLPAMVLPAWLASRTEPLALDDLVVALVRGLEVPLPQSASFDLPGPEAMSGREILVRTAGSLGLRAPVMVGVPLLTPWLSSHWVRFVTRAEWSVAREIVLGLKSDVLARDDRYWTAVAHPHRLPLEEAARRALAAEREDPTRGFPARWERAVRRLQGLRR